MESELQKYMKIGICFNKSINKLFLPSNMQG